MDRVSASEAKLRKTFLAAPDSARQFLLPRVDGDKTLFMLTKAIIVGRDERGAIEQNAALWVG